MNASDQDRLPRSSKLVRVVRSTSIVVYGVLVGAIVFACVGMLILLISLSIVDMIGVVPRAVVLYSLLVCVLVATVASGAIWGAIRVRMKILIAESEEKDDRLGLTDRNTEEAVVCSNCGSVRRGRWCSTCGQNDREYRRLAPVLSEVVGEMFEADSRVWKSLRMLLFKPGLLSLEFARNRRAYYLSPFRLYLFSSVLFFLVITIFELPAKELHRLTAFSGVFYEYLPINIFLVIPLYALLLQFVFMGQHGYAASFVFVLHLQTFGFLVLVLFVPWLILVEDVWQFIGFAAYFLPISVYTFFALKRFYGTRGRITIYGWTSALSIYIMLFAWW